MFSFEFCDIFKSNFFTELGNCFGKLTNWLYSFENIAINRKSPPQLLMSAFFIQKYWFSAEKSMQLLNKDKQLLFMLFKGVASILISDWDFWIREKFDTCACWLICIILATFQLLAVNYTLREMCPNTKLFLVRLFLYSVRIQENTGQK